MGFHFPKRFLLWAPEHTCIPQKPLDTFDIYQFWLEVNSIPCVAISKPEKFILGSSSDPLCSTQTNILTWYLNFLEIGSGGFGAVYQAKLGNYEVAVKVVDTSDEWDKFKFDNYDGKEDVHVPIMPLLATGFMDRLSRNSPQCYAVCFSIWYKFAQDACMNMIHSSFSFSSLQLLMPRAERSLYSLWETNLSSKDEAMWSLRAARGTTLCEDPVFLVVPTSEPLQTALRP